MRKLFVATAFAAAIVSGAAFAQTTATAATDLNLRSGPGNWHEVIGVITSGDEVSVAGCIESANWCQLTYNGTEGWAYGDYLAVGEGDTIQPLYPNRTQIGVTVIEPPADTQPQNTAVAGALGASMGAIIAGPFGAVAGAALGGATGATVPQEPAPEIHTYITEHPVDPVMLDGELVVGAGLPETVTLYEVPGYEDYRYVTVNGQTVLVGPQDRRIVYIYR
ncbi:MAG: DUF1236 domain-containing protein [Paracoccus sp. (in: a-proteobacteria)]|uniref:DUF1236 domain-containing protein n=1 Tax=Paracoccus sp. TaxID=267 RepID=UPI0026DF5D88|nr:DUF1236 domain-containing protein [Paracoccus sp. (in: a-proteobacteria)]MDO5611610.1 DUF1236 domain-containing protein [Paracoccus sp. (in: a-proteobacteria)]